MTAHRPPTDDLAAILHWHATTRIVTAIPLKPASWIVGMNPALGLPNRKRLTCVHAEKIQRTVASATGEPGADKPALGELSLRIRHVFPAEDAEAQHLGRCQFWPEIRSEITANSRAALIAVVCLEKVVHQDDGVVHVRGLYPTFCQRPNKAPSRNSRDYRGMYVGPIRLCLAVLDN